MVAIAEFEGPERFADAVAASFECDMVVVHNLITPEEAAALLPKPFPRSEFKIILNPLTLHSVSQAIPNLKAGRQETKNWLRINKGILPACMPPRYNLRPDKFKRGSTSLHIDQAMIVGAMSVNLTNGSDKSTYFFAERIAPAEATAGEIFKAYRQNDKDNELRSVVNMEVGDAVLVSRGVMHAVVAPEDRYTLMIGTKSMWIS